MGGGSGRGQAGRDAAWAAYRLALRGELPGLEPGLARWLREDRLSPGLRESLAGYAREAARALVHGGMGVGEALAEAGRRVSERFRGLVERDRVLVERLSPAWVLPLEPEEAGTWVVRRRGRVYITYWLRFPYDIVPGDGPEYEPFTVVATRNGRPLEYQFRVHWRLMRVDAGDVLHEAGRPLVLVAPSGHTPYPVVARLEVLARRDVAAAVYLAVSSLMDRLVGRKRILDFMVHVGPSRVEVAGWRRNPLRAPWCSEDFCRE